MANQLILGLALLLLLMVNAPEDRQEPRSHLAQEMLSPAPAKGEYSAAAGDVVLDHGLAVRPILGVQKQRLHLLRFSQMFSRKLLVGGQSQMIPHPLGELFPSGAGDVVTVFQEGPGSGLNLPQVAVLGELPLLIRT